MEQGAATIPKGPHFVSCCADDSSFCPQCDSGVGKQIGTEIIVAGPSAAITSRQTEGYCGALQWRVSTLVNDENDEEEEGECRSFNLDPDVFECRSISALTESEQSVDAISVLGGVDAKKSRIIDQEQKRGWTEHCMGSMCILFDDNIFGQAGELQTPLTSTDIKEDDFSQFKRRRLEKDFSQQVGTAEHLSERSSRESHTENNSSIATDFVRSPRKPIADEESLQEDVLVTELRSDENRRLEPNGLYEWSAMLNQCSELSRELGQAESAARKFKLTNSLLALYTILDSSSAEVGAEDLLRDYVRDRRRSLFQAQCKYIRELQHSSRDGE